MNEQPGFTKELQWSTKIADLIAEFRRVSVNRKVRIWALLVVLPLFGLALFVSWEKANISLQEVRLTPLFFVVAGVPFTVLTSTWQLRATARAADVVVPWWDAFRVVTLGTLSGLLPVSSASLVRAGAVVYWGVSPKATGEILVFDAIAWIGISLLYSGGASYWVGAPLVASMMLGAGIGFSLLGLLLARRVLPARSAGELSTARAVGMIVEVARLTGCFLALSYTVSFLEVSTLAAASPLASILFFLPGGLGVREGFTAAIGAVVGLSVAGAFLAAALNRLVGLTVLLFWEGLLLALPGSFGQGEPS